MVYRSMPEDQRPMPEELSQQTETRKFKDARHRLFVALMEIRQSFGSRDHNLRDAQARRIVERDNPDLMDKLAEQIDRGELTYADKDQAIDGFAAEIAPQMAPGTLSMAEIAIDGYELSVIAVLYDSAVVALSDQSSGPIGVIEISGGTGDTYISAELNLKY